jgi:hypothetical protein
MIERAARRLSSTALSCGTIGDGELPVPGQEFGDAARRIIGDASEHVGE